MIAQGVRDGTVTLAFRRWRRPDVKPGAQFRTSAGVIRVETIDVVDLELISDDEAARAGHRDATSVRKRLSGEVGWPVYRIGLSWVCEDPRIALRSDDALSDADVAAAPRRGTIAAMSHPPSSSPRQVFKFGGTSVGAAPRLAQGG